VPLVEEVWKLTLLLIEYNRDSKRACGEEIYADWGDGRRKCVVPVEKDGPKDLSIAKRESHGKVSLNSDTKEERPPWQISLEMNMCLSIGRGCQLNWFRNMHEGVRK